MKFKTIHDFLTAVQKNVDDRAVIAGGCLRDMLLGVKPKDVDIWVYNSIPSIDPESLGIEEGGFELVRSVWTPRSLSMIKVTTVIWKGVTFDIIRLRDPNIAAVDRFDFGINQVWYDGKHMHTTPAFDMDERNNTLTYLNTAENYLRLDRIIKDRIPRMLEKFPLRKVRGLIQKEEGSVWGLPTSWELPSAVVQELRRELLEIKEHLTPLEQIFLKVTADFKGDVEDPPLKEDVDKLRKEFNKPLYS